MTLVAVAAVVLVLTAPGAPHRSPGPRSACTRGDTLGQRVSHGRHPAAAVLLDRVTRATAPGLLDDPNRRVRFLAADLHEAAAAGTYRSPTFVRLLRVLEESDLIVQVEPSRTRTARTARLLMGPAAGGSRFVRIQVGGTMGEDDLIALIGHELFHAVEIAADPDVTSEDSLAGLYRRIGFRLSRRAQFDTSDSHVVESLIRGELLVPACRVVAESLRAAR
jgi:hypothetical protein